MSSTKTCCGSTGENPVDASDPDALRALVQSAYAKVASGASSSCCGGGAVDHRAVARQLGYSDSDLETVPEQANLGLGCGNPVALASLKPGEVVVDLGAGAGIDALVAAAKVGPQGRVIGVDMTPEMLERARENAVRMGVARTVEFREGVIEKLPVVSESADVVISNCVINLSPDKRQAFREAFRVLKPGGRLAVSDIVVTEPLPPELAGFAEAFVACVAGALPAAEYVAAIEAAGFVEIEITRRPAAELVAGLLDDPLVQAALSAFGEERVREVAATVYSYAIEAKKPCVSSPAS
jgi:arsenite methyltransferase